MSTTTTEVPQTLARALDPEWLTPALSALTRGARVTGVQTVEVIRTMATKARFIAYFEGGPSGGAALCLKAFLDVDAENARGGIVSIKEADFYAGIAPQVSVRVPDCVASVVDRKAGLGIIIMRDLIHEGAHFCTALEPLSTDDAIQSLEQLARLHASSLALDSLPWVNRRIADFARSSHMPQSRLQQLLDGARGDGLPALTRDAGMLLAGLKALAEHDATVPHYLIHGDCHAGNLFCGKGGFGLIDWQLLQRGGWALDVAYHIAAVLSIDVAERQERILLDRYLETMRSLGADVPTRETAWSQYRMAVVYGFYLWSITQRVEPAITNAFVNRLGSAVTRHDSYRLLGVAPGNRK